jgi:hypothetical protein
MRDFIGKGEEQAGLGPKARTGYTPVCEVLIQRFLALIELERHTIQSASCLIKTLKKE